MATSKANDPLAHICGACAFLIISRSSEETVVMNQDQTGIIALRETSEPSPSEVGSSAGRLCYVMAIFFLVAVCNMVDRMILGILQPSIQKEFDLKDAEF